METGAPFYAAHGHGSTVKEDRVDGYALFVCGGKQKIGMEFRTCICFGLRQRKHWSTKMKSNLEREAILRQQRDLDHKLFKAHEKENAAKGVFGRFQSLLKESFEDE